MKRFLFCVLLLASCTSQTQFEKDAIARAKQDPATAESYFLQRIEEEQPPIEQQAVYLYAMGVASERMGDDIEALNNYLSAEALGYAKATQALQRIRKKIP